MKRVLMVCNNFEINGISTVVMSCIRNIKRLNIRIDLFTGKPACPEYLAEIRELGSKIYVQENRHQYTLQYYLELSKVLMNNDYDAIYVHANSCTCILELIIAKLFHISERIVHCHSTSCDHKIIHKLGYPIFLKLYTKGIACSVEAGKHLFRDNAYFVLKNGIDIDRFRFNENYRLKYRNSFGIPTDAFVIGHVGYFEDIKNQRFLLDVFKSFLDLHTNAYLVYVGNGSEKEVIEALSKDYKIENNTIFLDTRTDVNEIYSCFDCFCLPSKYEGFGIVLIEAQANGLQCIASKYVPQATNLSGKVEYLEFDINKWCEKLLAYSSVLNRKQESVDNCNKIITSGYDTRYIADELVSFLYSKA